MTLSKQEESALLQVYEKYWQSYLNGDIPTLASLLAEDYTQIGSVETEVFDNKNDAVHFIETTIEQIAGKVDMRNRVKKIELVDPFVLIAEQTDLYILTEGEWVFYAKFRASSFLQKKEGQWKFIHQHSSIPDIRADEGENIATEKITRENIELRDAIKRRTVELEQKNQELALEASLERVRTVAMGMRKPDDLPGICEVLFNELQSMGFTELRNAMINIHNDEKSTFINYDYSEEIGPSINHLNYTIHPVIEKQIKQIRSTHDAFSETVFSGQDLANWKAFRKRIGEKDDTRIDQVDALFYYFYSIGTGAIGISTFGPITAQKLEQLKRFRNVFEFAYRRYMDVAQAEAQAKEAQIEAALERVRSKTMAMHNSQDVGDTVATMFDQLRKLGVATNRCGILIFGDTGITEVWTAKANREGKAALIIGYLDLTIHPMLNSVIIAWKNKEQFFSYELVGEDIRNYYTSINNFPGYPTRFNLENLPASEFHSDFFFPEGAVFAFTAEPIPDEASLIFKRFAGVFGQTYRRYLDLQNAEEQAREALIEAALERVRSRAMAMQSAQELIEVANVLREQMGLLGQPELETMAVHLYREDSENIDSWYAFRAGDNPMDKIFKGTAVFKKDSCQVVREFIEDYYAGKKEYTVEVSGAKRVEWFNVLTEAAPVIMESVFERFDGVPEKTYFHFTDFSGGSLLMVSYKPPSEESCDLQRRATAVFDLAYRRFLDLQKAEAQAREAQIEAALERVRSRTMGMQSSDELADVATIVFKQLYELDIKTYSSGFNIWEEKDDSNAVCWMSGPDGSIQQPFSIPYTEDPFFKAIYEAKKNDKEFFVMESNGVALAETYKYMFNLLGLKEKFNKYEDSRFPTPTFQITHCVFFQYGYFMFITLESYPEAWDIFKRFGKVFEQTYTRFLDLQKAEAQAREAQIEVSLERVRSRSMAMHKSDELLEAGEIIFIEMQKLGIESLTAGLVIIDKEGKNGLNYAPSPLTKKILPLPIIIPHNETIHMQQVVENWKKGNPFFIVELDEGETIKHQTFIAERSTNFPLNAAELIAISPARLVLHNFYFKEGYILVVGGTKLFVEQTDIMLRFAKVFQQTYTRFLDLQKAEGQAREATIEASLEKVRGKAMAMQNSNDLIATASIIFSELRNLGIRSFVTGVGLITKGKRKASIYSATSTDKGDNLSLVGSVMLEGHEVFSKVYDCWINNEDYFPVLKGEQLKAYYEKIQTTFTIPTSQIKDYVHYGQFLPFSEGMFYGWSENPCTEAEIKILQRFRAIVDLTFRRYIELQKSEANTLEAIRRASLDRVRAETASMRTTTDLERITPMIWNELITLGVPFIRCGVFIMDETQELIHTFLSTPDGKAIASFHLPYDASANLWETVVRWRKKEKYQQHWDEAAFVEWTKNLVQQGFISSADSYATEHRPANLYLHFLPFMQGMLYVGNDAALNENDLQLVQNLADAFSSAYARYDDFNRLEAAKEQVDKALTDLKQAQSQLVQAEKMASLGELTAGIAHEIQNPLNFVNNFSEINTELSEEIVEAARKGDLEEIIQLAADIKSNQDKISEHGKRADAIVKGMLQHSRSSSGIKEPTDINKLADEYFRLAYHGLRAKDKTFNTALHADYDTTIGKIPIMPQDIGRVLLNLYNNAFFAVSEKQKLSIEGYEPIVSIRTQKINSEIEIIVTDNGNGIPEKVIDKVFQPFFTTKPTGQGTGLGLSLSYDIIKAHQGNISILNTPGAGVEFIITLPVNA